MKKRIIAAIALVAVLASVLVGCGRKAECDFCGEEKTCTTKNVFGEKLNICKDCLADLEGLAG